MVAIQHTINLFSQNKVVSKKHRNSLIFQGCGFMLKI